MQTAFEAYKAKSIISDTKMNDYAMHCMTGAKEYGQANEYKPK